MSNNERNKGTITKINHRSKVFAIQLTVKVTSFKQ